MTRSDTFVRLYEERFGEVLNEGNRQFLYLLVAHITEDFESRQCQAVALALARRDVGPEFELAVDHKYLAGVAQLCRDVEVVSGILSEVDSLCSK